MSETITPIIVSIDGNIGSGKSTIIDYLSKYFTQYLNTHRINNKLKPVKEYKIAYLFEPVDEWQKVVDKNGESILSHFYKDQRRWAYAFQSMAYITRLIELQKAIDDEYDIIFTERSIMTDKNVFAKMLHVNRIISDIEYAIYNKWFDHFSSIVKNIKTVYIKTKPEICMLRIQNRKRTGEDIIPLSYLKDCHYYHETWLNNITSKDIIVIDGNIETNSSNFIDNLYFQTIQEKIVKFLFM